MPIHIEWDNSEKKILVYTFEGVWSLNEFYIAFAQGNLMMDSVNHTVHTILDMRKSGSLPNGFIGTIRTLGAKPHDNLGQMAMIGANGFVQSFINLSRRILPAGRKNPRFFMVSTLEEARAMFTPVNEMNRVKMETA